MRVHRASAHIRRLPPRRRYAPTTAMLTPCRCACAAPRASANRVSAAPPDCDDTLFTARQRYATIDVPPPGTTGERIPRRCAAGGGLRYFFSEPRRVSDTCKTGTESRLYVGEYASRWRSAFRFFHAFFARAATFPIFAMSIPKRADLHSTIPARVAARLPWHIPPRQHRRRAAAGYTT